MNEPIIRQRPGDDFDPQDTKDWMEQNDRRLKPHVISVPKMWQKHTLPTHRYPRECFARAIYFLHESPHLPNAAYVFGEALGGGINQHGWIEIEDRVVFDGVMQQFYDKAGYYAVELARPWYRFTRPAVMYMSRVMRKDPTLTYRWHGYLGLPWARDPHNPLLVDLERAKKGIAIWRRKRAGHRLPCQEVPNEREVYA